MRFTSYIYRFTAFQTTGIMTPQSICKKLRLARPHTSSVHQTNACLSQRSRAISQAKSPLEPLFLDHAGKPQHSQSDNFIFSSPRATRLTRPTRQFRNQSRTSARASQPDNLTISSPKLGEAYPSDTAIAEAIVGRRREPPSQTNLPFKSHARRGLPIQHSGYCAPVGRRREPPSQTNSSFPSARTTISNPVERQWDVG